MREVETTNGKRNKFWTHLMRHHIHRECGVRGRGEGVCGCGVGGGGVDMVCGVEEGWDLWGVVWRGREWMWCVGTQYLHV